ncbi:hypothetical protein B0H13DRAFT_2319903 [Mycena leptocephala]|nr:hypothetical protein B0H13DRAFT_2319903 [Mycena leptocephala]
MDAHLISQRFTKPATAERLTIGIVPIKTSIHLYHGNFAPQGLSPPCQTPFNGGAFGAQGVSSSYLLQRRSAPHNTYAAHHPPHTRLHLTLANASSGNVDAAAARRRKFLSFSTNGIAYHFPSDSHNSRKHVPHEKPVPLMFPASFSLPLLPVLILARHRGCRPGAQDSPPSVRVRRATPHLSQHNYSVVPPAVSQTRRVDLHYTAGAAERGDGMRVSRPGCARFSLG